MKRRISQLLICVSMLVAVVLGLRMLSMIHLLAMANPKEEMSVLGFSLAACVSSVLIDLSPFALYAAGCAIHRKSFRTPLGRIGLCVQVVYALIFIVGCVFACRLALAMNAH